MKIMTTKSTIIGLALCFVTGGQLYADYRWYVSNEDWCLTSDSNLTCLPSGTRLMEVRADQTMFEYENGNDGLRTFITFSARTAARSTTELLKRDERIRFVISYEESGIAVDKYESNHSVILQVHLGNDVDLLLTGLGVEQTVALTKDIVSQWIVGREKLVDRGECGVYFRAACVRVE